MYIFSLGKIHIDVHTKSKLFTNTISSDTVWLRFEAKSYRYWPTLSYLYCNKSSHNSFTHNTTRASTVIKKKIIAGNGKIHNGNIHM